MQALKALVIGMGILILLGTAVVIVTLVSRVGGVEDKGFGTVYLDLPASCRVAAVTAMEDKAILRLSGPVKDGCGRLVIVDPSEGRVLGRIDPGAAPSMPDGDG